MSSHARKFEAPPPTDSIDIDGKYKVINKIGQGTFAEVWLVCRNSSSKAKSNGKNYVLKRLNLQATRANPTQEEAIKNAQKEVKVLSELHHPNIVSYIDSFRSNDGYLNLVMTYCEGGDLLKRLNAIKEKKESLNEDQILEWFIQICLGLEYIHDKKILHRDLKTQNIFLTKAEVVKIGDFGIAKVLTSELELASTVAGTPFYMSPEIMSHQPYGPKADIWSLGCCVYEMVTLKRAFSATDINSLYLKVVQEMPKLSTKCSEPLKEIIILMLNKDPDDRPTAKQILHLPYMQQQIRIFLERISKKYAKETDSYVQERLENSSKSQPSSTGSATKANETSKAQTINNAVHKRTSVSPNRSELTPSFSRPSSSSTTSSNVSRSAPQFDYQEEHQPTRNDSTARHHHYSHRNDRRISDNEEVNLDFILKVCPNDTIQRQRRDHRSHSHSRRRRRPSSDEQDVSPAKSDHDNVNESPRLQPGRSPINDRSASYNQASPSRNSFSSARQRRREYMSLASSNQQSSLREALRPTSQEDPDDETEMNRSGSRDEEERFLVHVLASSLAMSPANFHGPNFAAYSRTDSNQTIVDDESQTPHIPFAGNQPLRNPLQATNRLLERYENIKQKCLQDISEKRLKNLLKLMDSYNDADLIQQMINELGDILYDKYSLLLFTLKFYEDSVLTSSI